MWKRIKENAPAAAAIATVFVGFAAIVQLGVLNPIQQRIDDLQAGLNQRFDAIDQRFDDQNSSINQRFDAQNISINQRFDAIDQRFNDLRADMNQRFEDQDNYIRQRFDTVEQRFNALDQRIDRLGGNVSELRKLSDQVSRNEGRIDAITQQLQATEAPVP